VAAATNQFLARYNTAATRAACIILGSLLAAFIDRSTATATGDVLPWTQGDLAISGDDAPLVAVAYNAAYYCGILLGPFLLMRAGRIRYLAASLVTYAAAALCCALSQSFSELIVFRVFLGFAGGGFFLGGLLTSFANLPSRVTPLFILGYAAVSQCASAVAPLLAGWIVNDDSWRILYIVLGLGAVAAAALVTIPASENSLDEDLRKQSAQTSTDFIGLGLLIVLISAYGYIMGYGEQRDWLNADDVALAIRLLAIVVIAFLAWECFGARAPIIPPAIFRERDVRLGVILGLAAGFPLFGTSELLQYLEGTLNFPLDLAGGVIAIRAIALLVSAPVGSALVARGVDSRVVMSVGFATSAVAFVWESFGISSGSEFATFIGPEILVGLGFGLTYAPLLLTVVSNVRAVYIPFAIALMNFTFVLPGSFANAALSTLFDHRVSSHWGDLASSVSLARPVIREAMRQHPSAALRALAQLVYQQSAVMAFVDVALGCAAIALIALPLTLALHPARSGIAQTTSEPAPAGLEATP
jgi:MFS transporter, DHA2 family, multidrug resistance protein